MNSNTKILIGLVTSSILVSNVNALDMGIKTVTSQCPSYQKLGSFRTENFGHAVELGYTYSDGDKFKVGIEVPDHEDGIKWSDTKDEYPMTCDMDNSNCYSNPQKFYYDGLRLWATYTYNFYACTEGTETTLKNVYGGLL
ncbi:hypothetical protein [Cysteiniphilum sp. QT6929]|uniref:hypothetical protein n=1 Tax=Cysteiniphilum sp. QT6929 TaxID=2975055 RepID=UPI0024B3A1AA|nr:hypothetical protein [Cysteiniphilum sp. QT6929]WHN65091.1 hypothetical protein NYP54_08575 [Cysteiniphilum sp. QT6929]